jgi:hypothetical protein
LLIETGETRIAGLKKLLDEHQERIMKLEGQPVYEPVSFEPVEQNDEIDFSTTEIKNAAGGSEYDDSILKQLIQQQQQKLFYIMQKVEQNEKEDKNLLLVATTAKEQAMKNKTQIEQLLVDIETLSGAFKALEDKTANMKPVPALAASSVVDSQALAELMSTKFDFSDDEEEPLPNAVPSEEDPKLKREREAIKKQLKVLRAAVAEIQKANLLEVSAALKKQVSTMQESIMKMMSSVGDAKSDRDALKKTVKEISKDVQKSKHELALTDEKVATNSSELAAIKIKMAADEGASSTLDSIDLSGSGEEIMQQTKEFMKKIYGELEVLKNNLESEVKPQITDVKGQVENLDGEVKSNVTDIGRKLGELFLKKADLSMVRDGGDLLVILCSFVFLGERGSVGESEWNRDRRTVTTSESNGYSRTIT